MASLAFALPFVLFLLGLVALLERRAQHRQSTRVAKEIEIAHERGSHVVRNQHPLIDTNTCVGCGSCVAACPEGAVLGLFHGQATLVHGSRCVGHALCAEACPVGAIRIGLGELEQCPDRPRLSESGETNIPGLFVAGELGGIALIRNAVAHGIAAIDTIAERLTHTPSPHPVVIVGAGPAGIAAALRARELGVDALVVEQEASLGGSLLHFPRRKLTLLQTFELPLFGRVRAGELEKEEVLALFERVVSRHQPTIRFATRVTGLQRRDGHFHVETTEGSLQGSFVLLALGRRGTPRKLKIPGEELPKVIYRLIDASSFGGRHALVIGGGDSAVEAAIALAQQKDTRVTLSYRRSAFNRLKARNEERLADECRRRRLEVIFSSRVCEIRPRSVSIEVENAELERRELANDDVLVFAGGVPPFGLLRDAGVAFGGNRKTRDARAI